MWFYISIIVIICWIYYIYLAHPDYQSFEYDELKHKFKTGDIILFHALDNINPIVIGTYYGHIGIVWVDPDDQEKVPYIFEAFNPKTMPFYPKEFSSGIALSSLEHRLNTYRGYCFYKELKSSIDIHVQQNFKYFIEYAQINMYYNTSIFNNSISKLLYNENLHNGTNCGELVYLSLIKLNLLPMDYLYDNTKHHLLWLSKLGKISQKNKYLEPVYILSNYFKK
jgi:hypothetical protein